MAIDISFSLPIALLDTCLVATGSQVLCQSSPQEHQLREGEGSAALSTATAQCLQQYPRAPQYVLSKEWILNHDTEISRTMS